jgi:uncharacterized RDD family membrane protein YckC
MAYCSNCGTQMSDQAPACPNCGHPTGVGPAGVGEMPLGYGAGPPYADFGKRFLALLIDVVIVTVVGFSIRRGPGGTILGFLYNWLMIAFNDGRTVGKMVLGIRVARPDGSAVDLGTAAARAGMSIVSGIVLGIGYLWAAWDPERRTWHDMVANTRVFDVGRTS